MDVLLPHCTETEYELLAIAMHNKPAFAEISSRIRPEWFYHTEVGQAFAHLIQLEQDGKTTDPVTAVREAADPDVSQAIVRAAPIFVSDERLDYLLERFLEYHLRRTYFKIGEKLQQMAYDSSIKPSELTDVVESEVMAIHFAEENRDIIDPKNAAIESLEDFYAKEHQEGLAGISLSTERNGQVAGFPSFDKCLYGLQPGDLILIAGQSGEGKTALAQNIAAIASIAQDYYTYYENTEMNVSQMVARFVAQMTGIPFEEIFTGRLTGTAEEIASKRKRIEAAHNKFAQSRIYLSELPSLTPGQSRGLARKFKHKYGRLDLLVIDYVGRMELDSDIVKKGLQEWQVLSRIAKDCKKLAQELKCAVILLAQLTEEGTLEGARKMINDTDAAFFLERLSDEDKEQFPEATHRLKKRKVRRGSTERDILLRFNKPIQRIEEVYFRV